MCGYRIDQKPVKITVTVPLQCSHLPSRLASAPVADGVLRNIFPLFELPSLETLLLGLFAALSEKKGNYSYMCQTVATG